MKQFKIDVSHASPGQLLTIAAELRIMGHGWKKFGPRILINGKNLQAPVLRIPGSGRRRNKRSSSLTNIKRAQRA
jgi:predicted GTPase